MLWPWNKTAGRVGLAAAPNCAGFRLRGTWRYPSVLTSALSRLVRTAARAAPGRKFGNP